MTTDCKCIIVNEVTMGELVQEAEIHVFNTERQYKVQLYSMLNYDIKDRLEDTKSIQTLENDLLHLYPNKYTLTQAKFIS